MGSKLLRRSGYACVEILNKHGWKPDAVFHCGVGLYFEELDVMKEMWENVQYFGAEPHPDVYKAALSKLYLGKEPYFTKLWECAIGEGDSAATFWAKMTNHKDGSSMFRHNVEEHNEHPIIVPVRSLDSLQKEHGLFGEQVLLWLDCEGSELQALLGASRVLPSVQAVNVELTGEPRGEDWCMPILVHQFLKDNGFWPIWVHTIRGCIGQYDMVFLRRELIKPQYCAFPMEVYDG